MATKFEITGFISGHTIKHLASALAVYFIYRLYSQNIKE